MSWSIYTVGRPDQVADRVNALAPPGAEFTPRDDQVKAAKAAALALIDSGALGDGEAFSISLSGHANQDHKQAPGYAADVITVTVAQVPATSVDQYDVAQAQQQAALE